MVFQKLLTKLIERKDVTLHESIDFMENILQGNLSPVQISAVLIALRMKGETVDEILGFIKVMRKYMLKVKTEGLVIDTCGTGGDGSGTFNISTAVAFVVAGVGVKVAKHGNRAASSRCGSADVLEALGVNISLTPHQAEEVLKKVGMVFLFAPLFHPAFKNVSQVRRELGVKTIFNYLGPFLNPAGVARQLIGVPSKNIAEKLAKVAIQLNYEHLLLVSSEERMDEISLSEKTYGYEIKNKKIHRIIINPQDYGFKHADVFAIKGGDAKTNAEIIRSILSGEDSAQKEIVVLNSAFALYVADRVKRVEDGVVLVRKVINEGKAKRVLSNLISETQKYA